MSWEEEMAGPYLPHRLRKKLHEEHARLQNAGFPRDQLLKHSQWEEAIFRQYCPQEVCDQVLIDHDEWEAGRLVSREPRFR